MEEINETEELGSEDEELESYFHYGEFLALIPTLLEFDTEDEPVNGYALYLLADIIWDETGIDAVLPKRFQGEQVGKVVRNLLERGSRAGSVKAKWLLEDSLDVICDEERENEIIGSRAIQEDEDVQNYGDFVHGRFDGDYVEGEYFEGEGNNNIGG